MKPRRHTEDAAGEGLGGAAHWRLGTVKWYHVAKGYGFITPDGGGRDVFVHFSAIRGREFRALPEGARVRFGVRQTPKGVQATDVMVVSGEQEEEKR